jgi:hypothetical protein
MGIFIQLHIAPERIEPKAWKDVYKESLQIVKAFPFLMRVQGEDGCYYAKRSEHTKNLDKGYSGWGSDGDMRDGPNTEYYQLIDDIQYYRERCGRYGVEDSAGEVLLDALRDGSGEGRYPQQTIDIWGNKSQGKLSHIPLLAVACLICDRFPDAAFVDGDISAGQCRRAVRWANERLKQPIRVPTTADMERLLPRLKAAIPDELECLKSFFEVSLEGKNAKVGAFLQKEFSPETMAAYWREELKPYHREDGIDRRNMREYLVLGLDFPTLCRLAMTDPEGNRLPPEEFMRELLKCKLHVPSKETWDYSKTSRERGDDESVDDVEDLLRKAWMSMFGGSNRNVDAYLPLEKICQGFQAALGTDFDAVGLAKGILQEDKPDEESAQSVFYDDPNSVFQQRIEEVKEKQKVEAEYDISRIEDLMDFCQYEDGSYSSVMPRIDEWMVKNAQALRGFAEETWDEFSALDAEGRAKWFRDYYRILIPEKLHKKILENIMDDDYIRLYTAAYRIDCRDNDIHTLAHALLWNEDLLRYYWDRAEGLPQD